MANTSKKERRLIKAAKLKQVAHYKRLDERYKQLISYRIEIVDNPLSQGHRSAHHVAQHDCEPRTAEVIALNRATREQAIEAEIERDQVDKYTQISPTKGKCGSVVSRLAGNLNTYIHPNLQSGLVFMVKQVNARMLVSTTMRNTPINSRGKFIRPIDKHFKLVEKEGKKKAVQVMPHKATYRQRIFPQI